VIHRQLERRGLASCVRWLGRVPHAECFRLASEHDLLFVPSRREAFGMVTVEAMSMGCVPIAYSVPAGSREIIEHGVSGFLISPYRRDCWIEQVVKLNNDRGTLELVSRNCTERARTHFNANRMGEQLRDFLRQVASRPIVPTRGAAYCSPLNTAAPSRRKASSYHRLPEPMRKWIRRFVARHPSWFAKLIHR
jgi:glycosyltransferase involved in cell wall biosynthesis